MRVWLSKIQAFICFFFPKKYSSKYMTDKIIRIGLFWTRNFLNSMLEFYWLSVTSLWDRIFSPKEYRSDAIKKKKKKKKKKQYKTIQNKTKTKQKQKQKQTKNFFFFFFFYGISAFWIPCIGGALWKTSTAQIWWESVHGGPRYGRMNT